MQLFPTPESPKKYTFTRRFLGSFVAALSGLSPPFCPKLLSAPQKEQPMSYPIPYVDL
nr:hypothetical protein Iba_chr09aCG5110 [Ipomoea batatas]